MAIHVVDDPEKEAAPECKADERLTSEEADTIYSLTFAAQVMDEMGERNLRRDLLREVRMVLARGKPAP